MTPAPPAAARGLTGWPPAGVWGPGPGASPDLNVILMVLTACNKAGRWEKALAVLRKHAPALGLPAYNFTLEDQQDPPQRVSSSNHFPL